MRQAEANEGSDEIFRRGYYGKKCHELAQSRWKNITQSPRFVFSLTDANHTSWKGQALNQSQLVGSEPLKKGCLACWWSPSLSKQQNLKGIDVHVHSLNNKIPALWKTGQPLQNPAVKVGFFCVKPHCPPKMCKYWDVTTTFCSSSLWLRGCNADKY